MDEPPANGQVRERSGFFEDEDDTEDSEQVFFAQVMVCRFQPFIRRAVGPTARDGRWLLLVLFGETTPRSKGRDGIEVGRDLPGA
ncbi:MAG: hypothetical protein ACKV19_25825 [Verrucomicrobiales bacterium]